MRWAEPGWLILLGLVVMPWVVEWRVARLAWPSLSTFPGRRSWIGWAGRWLRPSIQSAALGLLVVALARPQSIAGRVWIAGRGLSIVVVLDRSSSMTASDGPEAASRLEVARRTLESFIAERPDDLIGLVAFANYPDLLCPPTLDHETLSAALAGVEPARPIEDGTNIGDAVAWACEALSTARSSRKVIVLLTDGANDPAVPDPLDPLEAASMARALGIDLHTIAVGRAGGIVLGVEAKTKLPVPGLADGPDVALLAEMAERGGGRAFQAAGPDDLAPVMQEIDELERSPISGFVRTRYRERFGVLAAVALGLIGVDRLLAASRRVRLP